MLIAFGQSLGVFAVKAFPTSAPAILCSFSWVSSISPLGQGPILLPTTLLCPGILIICYKCSSSYQAAFFKFLHTCLSFSAWHLRFFLGWSSALHTSLMGWKQAAKSAFLWWGQREGRLWVLLFLLIQESFLPWPWWFLQPHVVTSTQLWTLLLAVSQWGIAPLWHCHWGRWTQADSIS